MSTSALFGGVGNYPYRLSEIDENFITPNIAKQGGRKLLIQKIQKALAEYKLDIILESYEFNLLTEKINDLPSIVELLKQFGWEMYFTEYYSKLDDWNEKIGNNKFVYRARYVVTFRELKISTGPIRLPEIK